jgi:hypothetical protein
MKKNRIFAVLLLMSIAINFMAYPQTVKSKATTRGNQMINKLSKDIALTDSQKVAINARMSKLETQQENQKKIASDSSNTTFGNGGKVAYKEMMDSILTPEQVSILRAKQDERRKAFVEQYKKSSKK